MTKKKGIMSQQLIQEMHLKHVFSIINDQGPIPRTDIKSITGLSATTVSSLVQILIDDNLVTESGIREAGTSGRKAVLLSIKKDGECFVGVSVSSTEITFNIYDLTFSLLLSRSYKILDSEKLGLQISKSLADMTRGTDIAKRIRGIAVGVPAVVDVAHECIISSTVLNIMNENIAYYIKSDFPDAAVSICNNSSFNAYAEKEFGRGDASNIIAIDIGEGVGAGILIDGNIYNGANGLAGELGHISVNYMGEKCKCNSHGCIELYLSVPAIMKRASSLLSSEFVSFDTIRHEAENGNTEILKMIEELAEILSYGIVNFNNVIDAQVIIICGNISKLGDFFLSPLRKFSAEKFLSANRMPEIRYSSITEDSVALGGAKYVFDKLLIK